MMIKPPLVTFCSVLGLFTVAASSTALAQSHTVQRAAEREVVRRQESVVRAQESLQAGNRAMHDKEYDIAVQHYRLACDLIPSGVGELSAIRNDALRLFGQASVKLAEQRIAEGRYADAETAAKTVLQPEYAPKYRPAIELLSRLEQPDYYNKTITPRLVANVEQVKQWLYDAQGYYDTGRYDLAEKRYHQVLNIDRYNKAARQGMEKVSNAKIEYGNTAYNQTRAELIWQVTDKWQLPVKRYDVGGPGGPGFNPIEEQTTQAISAKLNRIQIPRVEFRDATIREAVEFLKQKSREFDFSEANPEQKGVNIVLQLDGGVTGAAPVAPAPAQDNLIPGLEPLPAMDAAPSALPIPSADQRITLSLANVPLAEVLRYVTQLAGLKVKIEPYAVAIVPINTIDTRLITKEYKVPPGFLSAAPGSGGDDGGGTAIRTPSGGGGGGSGLSNRQTARSFLESHGVQFPPGASAHFISNSSRLIIRNSQDNIDLIDTIVTASQDDVVNLVEIESKFVEISQNNLKELSFDWLLGQFNIPGSDRVFGGGGTSGTGNIINNPNFPFVDPMGNTVGSNPLTAGNRTGTGLGGAISANAIDALLFPSAGLTTAAPGIFSAAGVFTDPQFQVVIRALNQKKGVDLLSAPRVTTKSGSRASIEVIREFIYPTEFEPPQIPQTVGSTGGTGLGGGTTSIPITPTTPTAFETRKVGVILAVQPVVGSDGATIDLELEPEVTEFEGFINYGSPILSPSSSYIDPFWGIFMDQPQQVVTPNMINQPVFSTRKVTTNVSIWDGHTVVLGGLIREDVQKVEDKVPFLGDIPFLGRAFRSEVDQHIKRNLVIFVTARLMNPAGEPVNSVEEEEEIVEPLLAPPLPEAPLPLFTK